MALAGRGEEAEAFYGEALRLAPARAQALELWGSLLLSAGVIWGGMRERSNPKREGLCLVALLGTVY